MTFYFLLGTHAKLAYAELEKLVSRYSGTVISFEKATRIATAELDSKDMAIALAQSSGGIIKAFIERERVQKNEIASLPKRIASVFALSKGENTGKFSFGTVCFGWKKPDDFDVQVKEELDALGVKSRFVRMYAEGVAPALSLHHTTHEAVCIDRSDHCVIAETIFFQDIDAWTLRDRQKPYRNARAGMLPPKIARIMLNIGIGAHKPADVFVYDPFCGSGTILIESMEIGAACGGSDIIQETVDGAKKNTQWYAAQRSHITALPAISCADATTARIPTEHTTPIIVTEPFLGRPPRNWRDVPNTIRGLEKLYIGCFKNWAKSLQNDATIIFIFPQFVTPKGEYSMTGLIDRFSSFGYTLEEGPYVYARPSAVVKREIVRFSYHRS